MSSVLVLMQFFTGLSSGAAAVTPTIPGAEFRVPQNRPHFRVPENRPHFRVEEEHDR